VRFTNISGAYTALDIGREVLSIEMIWHKGFPLLHDYNRSDRSELEQEPCKGIRYISIRSATTSSDMAST